MRIQQIQTALKRRFQVAGRGSVALVQDRLKLGAGYFKNQRRAGRRRVDVRVLFRSLDLLGVDAAEFFASLLGDADPVDRFRTDAAMLCRNRQQPAILAALAERNSAGAGEGEFDPAALDRLRYGEPRRLLRRTRSLALQVSDADLPVLLGIHASACRVIHKLEEAQIVLAYALDLAKGDNAVLADLVQRASYVAFETGEAEKALALSERATLIYLRAGDLAGVGKSLVDQGGWLAALNRTEEQLQTYESALRYLEADSDRLDVRRNRFSCLGNLSVAYRRLGDLRKARQCVRMAHRCSQGSGPTEIGKLHWLEAQIARDAGDLEAAERHFQRAVDALRPVAPVDSALCTLDLVRTQLRRGATAAAYQSAREMTALVQTLHKNRVAAAAVADCVRCALTGQGLSVSFLDRVGRILKSGRARQRGRAAPSKN